MCRESGHESLRNLLQLSPFPSYPHTEICPTHSPHIRAVRRDTPTIDPGLTPQEAPDGVPVAACSCRRRRRLAERSFPHTAGAPGHLHPEVRSRALRLQSSSTSSSSALRRSATSWLTAGLSPSGEAGADGGVAGPLSPSGSSVNSSSRTFTASRCTSGSTWP